MINDLHRFLDDWAPRLFQDRPDDIAPWFFDYFGGLLGDAAARRRYARALALDLDLAGFDPRGRTVIDAGSGFGVTLLCLARLGANALGLEAYAPMAASAGRIAARYAPDLSAHTLRADVARFPVRGASVDFIYCNEAISHFIRPRPFLEEAARVIRPGGVLMICDGNNGANPATVAEVHEVWRAFEEGPGNRTVHGHRIEIPYRDRRREMIREALPAVDETTAERLAWGTFGLHGTAVADRARRDLERGALAESPNPVDTCPVDPDKGDHIENLVYPDRMRRELDELGFRVRIHAHFGGARSPLIALANRALRAVTPLTLSRARSVKIVAVRR